MPTPSILLLLLPTVTEAYVVMINGLPGPMATAAAEACLRKGLTLAPFGLTGPDVKTQAVVVTDPDTNEESEGEVDASV